MFVVIGATHTHTNTPNTVTTRNPRGTFVCVLQRQNSHNSVNERTTIKKWRYFRLLFRRKFCVTEKYSRPGIWIKEHKRYRLRALCSVLALIHIWRFLFRVEWWTGFRTEFPFRFLLAALLSLPFRSHSNINRVFVFLRFYSSILLYSCVRLFSLSRFELINSLFNVCCWYSCVVLCWKRNETKNKNEIVFAAKSICVRARHVCVYVLPDTYTDTQTTRYDDMNNDHEHRIRQPTKNIWRAILACNMQHTNRIRAHTYLLHTVYLEEQKIAGGIDEIYRG